MKQQTIFKRIWQHWLHPRCRVEKYIPTSALQRLSQHIALSEREHLGQIRFVVESRYSTTALLNQIQPRQRAWQWFNDLRIWDTEHNSGVLIYISFADHAVEIIADRGINSLIDHNIWQAVCQQISQDFLANHYVDGLTRGLQSIDEILRRELPRDADSKMIDELPNDVMIT